MKAKNRFAVVGGTLACLIAACGGGSENPLRDIRLLVVDSLGEDVSLVSASEPPLVQKAVVAVGKAPNQVLLDGLEAFVLSSQSNSLEVIDAGSWTVTRQYALGDGCNPFWMAPDGSGHLWISCFLSNELIVVDPRAALSTQPVLARLPMPEGKDLSPADPNKPGFARPQGVAVVGNEVFVTLTNLGADWAPAGPGFLAVVDRAARVITRKVELASQNPGYVYAESGGGRLFVTASGDFSGNGTIEVYDVAARALAGRVAIGGAPGRMCVSEDGRGYVGDQLDGRVLAFDTNTLSAGEVQTICPADFGAGIYDFVSDVACAGSVRWAACFATDRVFRLRAVEDPQSFEVGDGPVALAAVAQ
jgi:DNA-binding beta-propeller fold protein YncE